MPPFVLCVRASHVWADTGPHLYPPKGGLCPTPGWPQHELCLLSIYRPRLWARASGLTHRPGGLPNVFSMQAAEAELPGPGKKQRQHQHAGLSPAWSSGNPEARVTWHGMSCPACSLLSRICWSPWGPSGLASLWVSRCFPHMGSSRRHRPRMPQQSATQPPRGGRTSSPGSRSHHPVAHSCRNLAVSMPWLVKEEEKRELPTAIRADGQGHHPL